MTETILPHRAFRRYHRRYHVAATRERLEEIIQQRTDLRSQLRIAEAQRKALLHAYHNEQKKAREAEDVIAQERKGFFSKVKRFLTRARKS